MIEMDTVEKNTKDETLNTTKELCNKWLDRAIVAQRAHYATAARRERQSNIISTLAILFNVVVGSAIFSMITTLTAQTELKIFCGITSILAALLMGIQALRRDGEKAEKHRTIAAKFSGMQRDLELLQIKKLNDSEYFIELKSFDERYQSIIQSAPTAHANLFKKYHKYIFSENDRYSLPTK